MQIRFITGDDKVLASLICRDGGPHYAKSLSLPSSGASALRAQVSGRDTVIIDHTLNDGEVGTVREFIEREHSAVLLKVVDSYWCRGNHGKHQTAFSALVETHCGRPNVAILTPYEPSEWLRMVVDKFNPKLLVLPYPYVTEAQKPLALEDFSGRLDRAILTGARS